MKGNSIFKLRFKNRPKLGNDLSLISVEVIYFSVVGATSKFIDRLFLGLIIIEFVRFASNNLTPARSVRDRSAPVKLAPARSRCKM